MKAKKSYKRGGMMEPIIGRPKSKKLEKVATIGPKKIDSGASTEKSLKKPSSDVKRGPAKKEAKVKRLRKKADSKFGVPGKKSPKSVGRLLRKAQRIEDRFENGGKTNKDSVRTDTLERSVDQVYANARREEEEKAKEESNSGTTSGYRNVGRPLVTARPGAPAKVKPLGPKKIDSGVSMDKTLKKSTAKISAPAENKRKRRLRRRK